MTQTPLPGDFGLVRIRGSVGFLIRLGQWLNGDGFADFEHAFVYIGDGLIVEAEPGGARISGLDEYAGEEILWSTGKIPLTGEQRENVVAAAKGYVGVPYDWMDYLSIALLRFGIRPRWVLDRVMGDDHLICSELVDYSDQAAEVQLFKDDRIPGDVTPGDLRQLLEAA